MKEKEIQTPKKIEIYKRWIRADEYKKKWRKETEILRGECENERKERETERASANVMNQRYLRESYDSRLNRTY